MTARTDRTTWPIPVTTLTNGAELQLTVHELRAGTPGPTVGLAGSVHGDENVSTAIVLRALERLERELEAGRVLALPVANPLAFEAITRNTPYDQQNLNRVFPGAREGLISEQIAYALSHHFVPECQVILDFHGAGVNGTVDYVIATRDEELAGVFGHPHVYVGPSFSGTLTGHAAQRGVRTLTPELGGVDMNDAGSIDKGLRGVANVLRHLGMLRGTVQYAPRQVVFTQKKVLKPVNGGVLYPVLGPGDIGREVPEGTVLATLVSPTTGRLLEEIRAPYARNLIFHTRTIAAPITPGTYAYQAADLDSARIIER